MIIFDGSKINVIVFSPKKLTILHLKSYSKLLKKSSSVLSALFHLTDLGLRC